MCQKFQEYFKENNIKIVLKYDGERKNKLFTVMLAEKDDLQNTLVKDTDNPYEVFQYFIDELNINISNEVNRQYFNTFLNLKLQLDKLIKSDLVFIFTSELTNELNFYISIISNEITTNFTSSDIKKVFKFIENLA